MTQKRYIENGDLTTESDYVSGYKRGFEEGYKQGWKENAERILKEMK
jgi:hypothetical protein